MGAVLMDAAYLSDQFALASAEDYKATAIYLAEALELIMKLEHRVASLEGRLNDADARAALMQKGMEFIQATVFQAQKDVGNLYEGVDQLVAMRDTLNAVFTIEAPNCPHCGGSGKWFDNDGWGYSCGTCNGTGKVQS